MKITNLIQKSLKEQIRSYWVLLLTLSMGPFFIFVYYLIIESSKPQYNLLIVNTDKGVVIDHQQVSHGKMLITFLESSGMDSLSVPFIINEVSSKSKGLDRIKTKKADALIVIPELFSQNLNACKNSQTVIPAKVEFFGDLTSTNYLISAVYANEMINKYGIEATNSKKIIEIKETALGFSANISMFDAIVPGILVVSLIMLMFPASIAFVSEVENKTIMRLKLSKVSAFEFIAGLSAVELIIGAVSVLLTLVTAVLLGFQYHGSLTALLIISLLTSMSIIAASLIIAAATKTANEVLVVGNFPMFLFMFFTGAAFPLKSDPLFTVAGYDISVQGLMTPTHAISALNKTFVLDMDIYSVIPEMTAIALLTIIYFLIGAVIFKHRHLKLKS